MINKKNKLLGLLFISFSIFYILAGYVYIFIFNNYLDVYYSHIILIALFTISIGYWNITYGTGLSDPINYILGTLLIFHSSQSLLWIFGIEGIGIFFNHPPTDYHYNIANYLISIGVLSFVAGSTWGKLFNHNLFIPPQTSKEFATIQVGIIIGMIGFVIFIIDFDQGWLEGRYMEFGPQSVWYLLWRVLLPVSGFILMINKKYRNIGIIILLFTFFIFILRGNRGYGFSLLLTMFWLYNFRVKRIGVIKGATFIVIVIVSITVFYQLKEATMKEKLDISTYFNMDVQPILPLLEEASGSYRTVIGAVQAIPEEKSYDYGRSYLWAISTIMPNLFGDQHPSQTRDNPSDWLRWTYNPSQARLGQGYGFSMIAEPYYNFGIYGVVLIMFFMGLLIMKLIKLSTNKYLFFPSVILAIVLHNLLWGIRNTFESIVRFITWEILVIITFYFILLLIKKTVKAYRLNDNNA